MAEMTDEERERRYKRFFGEVSPLRAVLDSPWADQVFGPCLEGYGLGILQQAREDRLRKKKEEACRRKEQGLEVEEQGPEPEDPWSTPRREQRPDPDPWSSPRREQRPDPDPWSSPRQEQRPDPEPEDPWIVPLPVQGPEPEPEPERSVMTDERKRRRKRHHGDKEVRKRISPRPEQGPEPEPERSVRRRLQGVCITIGPVEDKDSTSTQAIDPSREETSSHVELEREKFQVGEEQGNSQPQASEQADVLPPFYQDPDPEAPQYLDDMFKFYREAAGRLPLAQMPKLAGFLSFGGVLLGLNHPVTNIIINAIYLMGNFRHSEVLPHGADPVRHATDKASYVAVARRSRAALVVFMVSYFRHLTEAQAKRYLHAAGQDLALAVGLVEFHRKGGFVEFTCKGSLFDLPSSVSVDQLSPDCSRTKTALRYAAQAAMLPQDPNKFVRFLTSRFPRHLLELVQNDLHRGVHLSVGRVNDILNLLRHPWSPSPPLPAPTPGLSRDDDGNLTIITNIGQGLFSTTTITVATFNSNKNGGKVDLTSTTTIHNDHDRDGDDSVDTAYLSIDLDMEFRFRSFLSSSTAARQLEPDTNSLRMCLLDTIHGFYMEALAILPSNHHPRLVHAVLAAGHCYGIMDNPVHNIVINSIWYGLCYPPPNDETVQIDPLSLTRIASCSLNGLMVLKHNDQGVILTEQDIMLRLLGRMDCLAHPESGNSDYLLLAAAAEAAKHPQPLRLVELIKGLLPHKNRLHEVMDSKLALSDFDLCMIGDMITGVTKILPRNPDPGQPTLMDPGRRVQAHVRTKLEELLLNYCCKYHWGPQYKLSIILGVASTVCSSYFKGTICYHANFLASTGDVPASGCMLFFAEFWNQEDDDFEESKMPPACWPVPHGNIRYHRRCFVCESDAIRVVHPSDVNYFMGQQFCTDSLCAVAEQEHEAALGGMEVSNRL